MNSLGSSSKWSSYDSLPSTSSFVLSESEQTEDEADVFSEGEVDCGRRKSLSADEEITLSKNYLDFPGQSDQPRSRSKGDQSEQCPDEIKRPVIASSPEAATFGSSSATPGDLVFAQKCADLHRFIHPLLELLHGLKTGRFDKGLTSFQQSVAIDRLQRILGVLRKPEMGEKYLHHLLQIEIMLKMWFPQVAFQSRHAPNQTNTPPHRRQNQLHMPVKKRKLSWSDTDNTGRVPIKIKHNQHGNHGSCQASTTLDNVSTCLPGLPEKQKNLGKETVQPAGTGTEFTDITGTLSTTCLYNKRETGNLKQPDISLPSSCVSLATQDNSVSSSDTTDSP
ncbi:circadian associated repressor of transcription a [Mastacembelus armatus]|uniref:Circadian associated repressor of transcription a n=1 Tax=Mastacembelus armatus TaxID=205130 RepID=A0A7N8YHV4_9TELE|nr:circadian-associated transcriptional repressor [Mastacembelus armatus]